ncbi:hypothetical protein [Kutzneria sp. NPDC051319]|uniref:hypothetical protein n=1 Tax=Kutzneria sp. NPDC051319 TaxID=3155047 RepID=UPI003438536A
MIELESLMGDVLMHNRVDHDGRANNGRINNGRASYAWRHREAFQPRFLLLYPEKRGFCVEGIDVVQSTKRRAGLPARYLPFATSIRGSAPNPRDPAKLAV